MDENSYTHGAMQERLNVQALKQMHSFGAQNLGNLAWALATLGRAFRMKKRRLFGRKRLEIKRGVHRKR